MTRPLPRLPASWLDQLTPIHWAIGGLVAGVLLVKVGGPLLGRLWFRRWLMSGDLGEYQRWTHTDRHGALVDQRSHAQRRGEAAVERRARLLRLAGYSLTAGIGAAVLGEAWFHSARPFGVNLNLRTSELGLLVIIVLGMTVLPLTAGAAVSAAWNLLWEIFYLLGLQGWRGARVLDPPPTDHQSPWGNDKPPFGTGGPADPSDVGDLFGGSMASKPKPKFKD